MLFLLKTKRRSLAISRILLHAAIAFALAGCKFVPLYGESTAGDARFLKLVKIAKIDDRPGQKLRTMLKQKFGQRSLPKKPRWLLSIKLSQTKRQLAVKQDSTTTRRELAVTASFTLQELGKNSRRPLRGKSLSMSSFNQLGSEYAILVAENDALDRSLNIIANDLRNRIMLAIRHKTFFKPERKN